MSDLQWFILAMLTIIALVGVHRRVVRSNLIKHLEAKGKSSNEIARIMRAYEGDQE